MNVKQLVEKILADGVITKREYADLERFILRDDEIDAEENAQINRLFEMVQKGEIKVE